MKSKELQQDPKTLIRPQKAQRHPKRNLRSCACPGCAPPRGAACGGGGACDNGSGGVGRRPLGSARPRGKARRVASQAARAPPPSSLEEASCPGRRQRRARAQPWRGLPGARASERRARQVCCPVARRPGHKRKEGGTGNSICGANFHYELLSSWWWLKVDTTNDIKNDGESPKRTT